MGIGRFLYTPVLPFMVEALDLTKAEAGLIASANYLGYLAGALAAAWFVPPAQRRAAILIALIVSMAANFAMPATASVTAMAAIRFGSGVASAFALVAATALVLETVTREGRAGLGGLHFAGVGCGMAVSAVAVSALSDAGLGWDAHWYAGGALTAAAAGLAILLLPIAPADGAPTHQSEQRTGQRTAAVALIAAYGLFGFGYVITATFVSTLVRLTEGLRETESVVWLVVGLSAAPSVVLWNRVAARYGAAPAFAIACLLEAFGVALSVVTDSAIGILAAAALLGGTFMGITGLGLVLARGMASGDPTRILGLMTASFGVGQIIGPVVAGYSFDVSGSFAAASFTASGTLIIAALLMVFVARSQTEQ